MKKSILLTMGISLFLISAAAEQAVVRFLNKEGTGDEKVVKMQARKDGALRVRVKKEEIPEWAAYVEIVPDFAHAKKGDPGYWIFPRGEMGTFRLDDGEYATGATLTPIFGMKTPERTFVGFVKGLRFEYIMRVTARSGVYSIFPRFDLTEIGSPPYEDIRVDYYKLEGDKADYSGMARFYRDWQISHGKVVPIKERMKTHPYLKKLSESFPVRMTFAAKPEPEKGKDYTPQTELPLRYIFPFEKAIPLLEQVKKAGLEKLAICVAGWQTGGYDGRCPATFPICEECGGEDALKRMVKTLQDMGFIVDAHSNYTDCFTCSPMWSETITCKKRDGSPYFNGTWSGGKAYNLCLRNAWETFLPSELEKISKLGFRGACYIDVFSATMPYRCFDPKHPATRKEIAEYQNKVLERAVELFGGAASECGFDHVAGNLDYVNYVYRSMKTLDERAEKGNPALMVDRVVPFWELTYHGIILSTADKCTQGIISPVNNLRNIEFGSRPIFYSVSPSLIPHIKKQYDQFMPMAYLQKEFMNRHEKLGDDVYRTVYADGSETIVNYSNKEFAYKGKTVKPMDFILIKDSEQKAE